MIFLEKLPLILKFKENERAEGAKGAERASEGRGATERSARSERDERPERLSDVAGARERSGLSEGARRSERPKRAFHKLYYSKTKDPITKSNYVVAPTSSMPTATR